MLEYIKIKNQKLVIKDAKPLIPSVKFNAFINKRMQRIEKNIEKFPKITLFEMFQNKEI